MIGAPYPDVPVEPVRDGGNGVSLYGLAQRLTVMPIYVFRCESCGNKFDHLQKLSAPDPVVCPHCGQRNTLRRQVTAPAFRLAGSGWYETDFKSAQEKKHNLADNGTAKPESGGDKPAGDKGTGEGKAGEGKPASPPPAADRSAESADD